MTGKNIVVESLKEVAGIYAKSAEVVSEQVLAKKENSDPIAEEYAEEETLVLPAEEYAEEETPQMEPPAPTAGSAGAPATEGLTPAPEKQPEEETPVLPAQMQTPAPTAGSAEAPATEALTPAPEEQAEEPAEVSAAAVIAPFGREDTSMELQSHAAKTQDTLVDAVENAEVAEIKRAIFRSLTRLRAAEIKEFDTIARLETQAIDEYNDDHHYRAENPLEYLHEAEGEVQEDKYTSFHG